MAKSVAVYQLSDRELLVEVQLAAGHEREATARLIALLAEVDGRRLYLGEGCSSLFTYCTRCSTSWSTRHMDESRPRVPLDASQS